MASVTDDAAAIQQRMAAIRRELYEDVRDVVASAEAVADWHRYIRNYPWIAVGAAFAVGYFVVPKRRRVVVPMESLQATAEQLREATESKEKRDKERTRKSLLAAAWAMVTPVVIRAAQSYAAQYLENWVLQQQAQTAAAGPPPAAPTGQQWPRGQR